MPIFQLIAIDTPKWIEKALDKLRRSFLWSGSDKTSGGKCLVQHAVCSPRKFGGLGTLSFQQQRRALKMCWLWQQWSNPDKPWTGLPIPTGQHVQALFDACTRVQVRDGRSSLFWKTPWIMGAAPKDQFPNLFLHSRFSGSVGLSPNLPCLF